MIISNPIRAESSASIDWEFAMDSVKAFADVDCSDVAIAGGKGANLSLMSGAGLAVPPGFVVATPAYREFVARLALPRVFSPSPMRSITPMRRGSRPRVNGSASCSNR